MVFRILDLGLSKTCCLVDRVDFLMHVGILPLCQPVSPPAYCTKRQRGCQEENQVVIVISVQGSEDKGSTLTGIESSVIEVTDVDL